MLLGRQVSRHTCASFSKHKKSVFPDLSLQEERSCIYRFFATCHCVSILNTPMYSCRNIKISFFLCCLCVSFWTSMYMVSGIAKYQFPRVPFPRGFFFVVTFLTTRSCVYFLNTCVTDLWNKENRVIFVTAVVSVSGTFLYAISSCGSLLRRSSPLRTFQTLLCLIFGNIMKTHSSLSLQHERCFYLSFCTENRSIIFWRTGTWFFK